MSLEKSPKCSETVLLSKDLEFLIERVVERTLARIESSAHRPFVSSEAIERIVERTLSDIESGAHRPFISSKACARLIGVTSEHLCAMRARGEGPPWSGDGRWTRYRRCAVLEWLASLPRQNRSE
jgi:hypothetical protein